MADDSTRGIRGVAGKAGSPNDGLTFLGPRVQDFAVLRGVFEFHPLALEDSEDFGQRAKLDDYDDFVFLVVYGAVPDEDRLVEVHCFYSERFLITVHRDEAPALTEVRASLPEARGADRRSGAAALPDHRRPSRQFLPDPGRF
jgi:Mg2+ and Co2+ transporter CorA